MTKLVIRLVINAVALWAAASFIGGIHLSEDIVSVAIVAAVFGIINAFIKPIVKLFSFPFIILTLGIFTIIINAAMLLLTDYFTQSLHVESFMSAIFGSIVISIVSIVLSAFLDDED